MLKSVGKGADVTSSDSLRFGRPAEAGELNLLENNLGGRLTQEIRELLLEFNGVWIESSTGREPWFLSTSDMERAAHFYDDWESDLVLKVFPKVAFVCQQNGLSELWGVVIRPFKPFKRGDIVALDHDRIHEAETADELFTRPYGNLHELVEARVKKCD